MKWDYGDAGSAVPATDGTDYWSPASLTDLGQLANAAGFLHGTDPLPFADNSSGANWAGTPPTNTTDAINRLTAALAGLLGTPIP